MTLTSEITKVRYDGNPPQTSFPITFIFWDKDDPQAILTDANGVETTWTRGVQYTVTGGGGSTGTLTATTAPASGETLTITSNLNDTQDTSLPAGGPFPSTSVEQQLDKIVRLIQQKAEALGRAIKLKASSVESDATMDDFAGAAGRYARVRPTEDGFEYAAFAGTGLLEDPVPVANGGTASTTAAAARTSLGLATVSQAEAEAGTATTERAWTAERVAQAIATLGGTASTGDIKPTFASSESGWLLLNGDTVGSASSGATQANAANENLFTFLWNNLADAQAPVSTGRGASAATDWAANKTITMPDGRGRSLIGAGTGAGLTARTVGATGGAEDVIVVTHNHGAGSFAAASDGDHTHGISSVATGGSGGGKITGGDGAGSIGTDSAGAHTHTISSTSASAGSSGADANLGPWLAANWLIKL